MALRSQRTVLIADDEVNLRKVLSAMLRREGFEVLTAADGEGAVDLLKKTRVDLVLTDLRMPKMDGMALLRFVLSEYVGLPVIMGPNGKLVKPMAAILCVDLDGRINVNTAGTIDLVLRHA